MSLSATMLRLRRLTSCCAARFSPAMHINYDSRLMDVKDGLPKFKDVPAGFGGTDEKLDESEW